MLLPRISQNLVSSSPTGVVLIKDSARTQGDVVFAHLFNKICSGNRTVLMVNLERGRGWIGCSAHSSPSSSRSVRWLLDACCDQSCEEGAEGWSRVVTAPQECDDLHALILDTVQECSSGSSRVHVFLDSITPLLLHSSPAQVALLLRRLGSHKSVSGVVCTVHLPHAMSVSSTVHAILSSCVDTIERECAHIIHTHATSGARGELDASIVCRRSAGKASRERVLVSVMDDGSIKASALKVAQDTAPTSQATSPEPEDPTAIPGLTFNLKLSESEKAARAGTAFHQRLPYAHHHSALMSRQELEVSRRVTGFDQGDPDITDVIDGDEDEYEEGVDPDDDLDI